jgi:glutamate-1-semialdehyde 2,1-aminomutase
MMDHTKFLRQSKRSAELFSEARKVIPSGSSSLIRVAGHDPYPLFMQKGKGSHIWDVDGNEFVDLLMSYGVLINGHAHPRIMEALRKQLEDGTIFGTPTELELKTAKKFKEMVPSDMVLFCNSGTEATMHAIRMARAVTGKDRIVKFEGAYHGQHDYVMFGVEPSETGLEIKPYSVPYDPGIPDEISRTVVLAPWNNAQVLERIMKRYRNDIAAIITEPVMANCGVILPQPDYLHQLKEIAERYEALLIFDEVVTGFRVSMGGAQEYYGVEADLCTYGKALGGGVPIAAIGGKKEVLEMVSPGKMVFGGTYNANPLSLAGAYANLEILSENGGAIYGNMHRIGTKLMKGLEEEAQKAKVEVLVQGVGSVYQVFFTYLHEIQNYREALNTNDEKFQTFQQGMLNRGVYIHPDPFERQLISTVHTDEDVEKILQAARESFVEVREKFE